MSYVLVEDVAGPLAAALARFVETKACPDYLRTPARKWLAARSDARLARDLATALRRFIVTRACPEYVRAAAERWLAATRL